MLSNYITDSMEKRTKIILLAGIGVVVAVAGYFAYRAIRFGSWRKNSRNIVFVNKTESGDIVIANFDSAWDYKYVPSASEGNQWFTKRKGTTAWTNMKTKLSAANYEIAINKLIAFIKK